MPHELVYSGRALADLEAILNHVALDSPREARRWVAEIEKRCVSCFAISRNSASSAPICRPACGNFRTEER